MRKRKRSFHYLSLVLWGIYGLISFVLTGYINDVLTNYIDDVYGVYDFLIFLILIWAQGSVKQLVARKWRAVFNGTVYGRIFSKDNSTKIIPLKNVEISYNSPFLEEPGVPVFSDVDGKFCFEHVVPIHKPITLEAKVGKDRMIYQHVGRIEGVKWFLGEPTLKLPLSSGVLGLFSSRYFGRFYHNC